MSKFVQKIPPPWKLKKTAQQPKRTVWTRLGFILFVQLVCISPCYSRNFCIAILKKFNGTIRGALNLTYSELPNKDPRLENTTHHSPSVPGGSHHTRGDYFLGESNSSYFSKMDSNCGVGGLSQCTATLIFNVDTGKYLVHHSSRTLATDENINKLGAGKKKAIVISAYESKQDSKGLTQRLGIKTDAFDIPNASSHIQVRYDGTLKEVIVSWKDNDGQSYLLRWSPYD